MACGKVPAIRTVLRGANRQAALPLSFGLEDNLRGLGPRTAHASIGPDWRALRADWRPTSQSPHARLYIWSTVSGAVFSVRRVVIRELGPGGRVVRVPMTLRGSAYDRELERSGGQRNDTTSHLVRRARGSLFERSGLNRPGIGWGRFPEFARDHERFGRLPTHSEYMRFLAELGLLGVLLLFSVGAGVVAAGRRTALDRTLIAAFGGGCCWSCWLDLYERAREPIYLGATRDCGCGRVHGDKNTTATPQQTGCRLSQEEAAE